MTTVFLVKTFAHQSMFVNGVALTKPGALALALEAKNQVVSCYAGKDVAWRWQGAYPSWKHAYGYRVDIVETTPFDALTSAQ